MAEKVFEAYVKEKLPREDDKKLFGELFRIYQKEGKEALSKHLKDLILKMEE